MKKVKLKNIAEPLGVSITTVHRALNNVEGVNEKTREMIFEKARELGHEIDMDMESGLVLNKRKKLNIAVLCPYDLFFETVIEGMKSAKKHIEYENVNIDFKFEEVYDAVKQSEQLREIVRKNNIDAIAIAPAHPLIMNPLINELVDNGKVVVTFNTDAPASKRYCYIGQNPLVAGKMAAEILTMKVGDKKDIAVFKSFSVTSGVRDREKGFIEFVSSSGPDISIIGPFEYFDNIEEAERITEQIILNNPNIGGLFANNMAGTLGCARAVRSTGFTGTIFVVGYDDNEEIRQFINDGIIVATVLQDPYYQGYITIRTLFRLLKGNKKPNNEIMHTQCNLLMKSSLELYDKR